MADPESKSRTLYELNESLKSALYLAECGVAAARNADNWINVTGIKTGTMEIVALAISALKLASAAVDREDVEHMVEYHLKGER